MTYDLLGWPKDAIWMFECCRVELAAATVAELESSPARSDEFVVYSVVSILNACVTALL